MKAASSTSTPTESKTTTGSRDSDDRGGIKSDGGGGARARAKREYHNRFVAALERHGGEGGGDHGAVLGRGAKRRSAWDDMAESMGGGTTVDEVKLYAYRYMLHLQSASTRKKAKVCRSGSGQKGEFALLDSLEKASPPTATEPPASLSHSDTWSYEDSVLFETLLARYAPDGAKGTEIVEKTDGDDQDGDPDAEFRRWDQIASMIPGKTSLQVREQYRKRFGGGTTSDAIAAAGSATISTAKQKKEQQKVDDDMEMLSAAKATSQG